MYIFRRQQLIIFYGSAVLLLLSSSILSQAPDTSWTTVISDTIFIALQTDARQTTDGDYILSDGRFLTRVSQQGNQNWQTDLQASWPFTLNTHRVRETSDGQFIVVGDLEIFGGGTDHLIAGITSNGSSTSIFFEQYHLYRIIP